MINISPGQSGYFSKPSQTLDPHLFDGEHLKPDVRTRLNLLLLDYLDYHYHNAESWTMVWLAGSGISYQWSADRGNGDLDVLFGIDYDKFLESNPNYSYMSREEIAECIDNDLRISLWPKTSHIEFSDEYYSYQAYEVTFFLNPMVDNRANGITNIRPYAAYNITLDEWTTKPPKTPETNFPEEFERQANDNKLLVKTLSDRYNSINSDRSMSMPNSPRYINAQTHVNHIKAEAQSLYDSIHTGRKAAFQSNGGGYSDFYNYQWQKSKADGLITTLNEIINGA
jgi:hypothetical protein